ncbi:MAG: hypothetical protein CFH18_00498 [Alphaproteobacteria bacterium MarineAlpha5_Bin8]|nr:MAG: hypothetical protein CFH17_00852 [Alphaproteobacteria bacterium MarineAlpha5_Bin7]PPR46972.1 MAG: hypothetical protein CFH18_00498 [Alphaproteobacteria bacterium MarineAlpha5_Bin8]PPR52539.1 MAG: hypothetical protein CFH16_01368 [Alphaproteobacteria bacterium MarineAlpha5_Bin6]|tara:strand:+ start:698 stop:943 length:246 start_codon:yes stop_codon:yes gene_type:complete
MVRIIFFIIFFLFSSISISTELNKEEEKYFNFFDFNKDNKISLEEINQTLQLLFQLVDENNDNEISKDEIIKLKSIIESFS